MARGGEYTKQEKSEQTRQKVCELETGQSQKTFTNATYAFDVDVDICLMVQNMALPYRTNECNIEIVCTLYRQQYDTAAAAAAKANTHQTRYYTTCVK